MDAIVSVTADWAIGKDGGLLVRNKDDMHRFVELTRGHTCVMGRKTYESFPGGPLKGRRNIIVTHQEGYVAPKADKADPSEGTSVQIVHSLAEAFETTADDGKVWLIGGESLYRALVPCCASVYVTKNDVTVEDADAFFPNLDEDPAWTIGAHEGAGVTKAGIPFEFVRYDRTPTRDEARRPNARKA